MSAAAIAQSSPARPIAARQFAAEDFEQRLFGERPGRDEADDGPVDQRLRPARLPGLGGAFGLLGNRHTVARTDQAGEIGFGGMYGNAAHRDRLAIRLSSLGQRDVETGRCGLRVIEEQFEEVAHAIEQ